MYELVIHSPFGPLTLTGTDRAVTGLRPGAGTGASACPVLVRAAAELAEYFAGERRDFTVPLAPAGTAFQQRVWAVLRSIPYGETRAYRDVALAAGCPKGFRAVGLANNRNPIPIFIPCHRVIGSDGSLTGYAWGLDVKRRLLALEGARISPGR